MDIIYNIQQTGVNKVLFNETVNATSATFSIDLTNPWTAEEKTAIITAEGDDGEWVINFEGVTQPYEDLSAGLIEFETLGTWTAEVNFDGSTVRTIRLQVV